MSTGSRPAQPRPTRSIRVTLAALATFATGLVAFSLAIAPLDPADHVATPVRSVFLLTVLLLIVLTVAMLRGSRRAWLFTLLTTGFFVLAAAGLWIRDLVERLDRAERAAFTVTVTAVRRTPPSMVEVVGDVSPFLIVGGAAWATVALLLPTTRRDLRRMREAGPGRPAPTDERDSPT